MNSIKLPYLMLIVILGGITITTAFAAQIVTVSSYPYTIPDNSGVNPGLDVSSSGFVGIGTSSPNSPLMIQTSDTSVLGKFKIVQSGTGDAGFLWATPGAVWNFGIDQDDSNKFKISNDMNSGDLGVSTRLTIDSSGNVGIGTSSPSKPLYVVSTSATGGIAVGKNDNSNVLIIGYDNTNNVGTIGSFAGGNAGNLELNSLGGNVGIGTATPQQALDVAGNIRLSGNIVSPNDICIGTC